jgi:hypothetical protein
MKCGSPLCGQSEPINDIMYSVMETNHVGFVELKVKVISTCMMLRDVLVLPGQFLT